MGYDISDIKKYLHEHRFIQLHLWTEVYEESEKELDDEFIELIFESEATLRGRCRLRIEGTALRVSGTIECHVLVYETLLRLGTAVFPSASAQESQDRCWPLSLFSDPFPCK